MLDDKQEQKPDHEKTVHELIQDKAKEEEVEIDELKKEPAVNFMTALYENDTFRFEKEQNEKQIIESAESRMENKNFLDQMDDYLKDLQSWRMKREPSEQ